MTDAPEGRAIRVTYATHSSPQAGALISHVTGLLQQQFPLRNVHWRPSPSTRCLRPSATRATGAVSQAPHAIRTLQMLSVNLVPVQAPVDVREPVLARTPCVHLFFVSCDDNDVYRSKVRSEIRNWIASLPSLMPQDFTGMRVPGEEGRDVPAALEPEFLIVLVPPMSEAAPATPPVMGGGAHPAMPGTSQTSASKGPMNRFYNMNKGTVLEKVKADFNSSLHERVVQLPKLPGTVSPAATNDPVLWIELIARMKECVANTIGSLVELQDRTITLYDAQRGQPSWSFSQSFARTEQLIETLEGVELLEDSLTLYQELDQRLAAGLADGTASFPAIGGTDPGDDSLLLLGPLRKPYHTQLEQGTISLFDLRCYLFAQQAMLLGTLGHVLKVIQATPAFIAHVAQMYARYGTAGLPRFFVEAWSFSVALDAVEQCQAWLVEQTNEGDEDPSQLPAFHAAKADLLELAVRQLLRIGLRTGHLPDRDPFRLAEAGGLAYPDASDAPITRKELVEAMDRRDVFDMQLRNLIQRAVLAASFAQQQSRLFRLKYVLASLDMLRGTYDGAAKLFAELLTGDASAAWGPLHAAVHASRLACLRHAERDHGVEWVDANLAALRTVCATRALVRAPQPLDEHALLVALQEESATLDQETTLVGYNGFRLRVVHFRATRADDDDGAWLDVDVFSHLGFPLEVHSVGVYVSNYQQDQLWFQSAPVTLYPGTTSCRVYCAMPAAGFFHVQATQVRLGTHVLLEQLVQGALSLSTLADAQQHEYTRTRIFVPADGDAADVRILPQTHVQLDAPRHAVLEVAAGRNALTASMRIEPGAGVRLAAITAPTTDGAAHVECDGDVVRIEGLAPHTHYRIPLPFAAVPRGGVCELLVTLRYRTQQSHADVERVRVRRLTAALALPLGIQIQDHFRLAHLLSQLTLEASPEAYTRIAAPRITAPESGALQVQLPAAAPAVLIPEEPSAVLLRFTLPEGQHRTAQPETFRLTIAYRGLVEEAQALALLTLAQLPQCAELDRGDQALVHDALVHAIANAIDTPRYAWTGRLGLAPFDPAVWDRHAQQWGWPRDSVKTRILHEVLAALYTRLASASPPGDAVAPLGDDANDAQQRAWDAAQALLTWRTLSLPLDVPLVDVVAAVTVESQAPRAVVAQPIEVEIRIEISLRWGAPKSEGVLPTAEAQAAPEAGAEVAPADAPVDSPKDIQDDAPATAPAAASSGTALQDADDASSSSASSSNSSSSSLSNAAKPLDMRTIRLQYNIGADYVHWIVWGDKKGTFTVPTDTPTYTHTVRATLLPVHAGALLLPRVRVSCVSPTPRSLQCESYMTNGAACIDTLDPVAADSYWVDLAPLDRRVSV